jgi:hypothetical protein
MKTSNTKLALLMIITGLFYGCGEQGIPGTAGLPGTNGTNGLNGTNGTNGINGTNAGLKDGAFKAIVSGTLNDGTAYSDSINFDYCNGYETFSFPSTNQRAVTLYRSQFPTNETYTELNPRLSFALTITDIGSSNQTVSLSNPSIDFLYARPLTQWLMLEVVCQWIDYNPTLIKFPIDPASNTFNFKFGQPNVFLTGTDSAFFSVYTPAIPFYTTTNDTVYYSNPFYGGSGSFIKLVDQNGNVSTSSSVYSSIHLVTHSEFAPYYVQYLTFANSNNKDLSKTITVAPDSFKVSNLLYNGSTAVLSFDFTVTKNVYRNATLSPINITGSFSGHVYVIDN